MKRPSFGSIFWFLAFVGVSYLLYQRSNVIPPPKEIIFSNSKSSFYDSGDAATFKFVGAVGALTGEGLAHPNNINVIACYEDHRECLVNSIEQIAPNMIGFLNFPDVYPIKQWDADEIVASDTSGLSVPCRRITISLERKSETAVWVEEPINVANAACKYVDTKTLKLTIEDSPSWKSLSSPPK